MKIEQMKYGDMLDIIFASRNRAYGAYYLRRTYGNRVVQAIVAICALVILVTALFFLSRALGGKKAKTTEVEIILTPPPSIEDQKKAPPPPPPKVKTPPPERPQVKYVPPVLKKEVKEEDPPPEVKEIENKDVGAKTVKGDSNAVAPILDEGPGEEPIVETPKPPVNDDPVEFAEIMPTFPGGEGELRKFLNKNIQYPDIARENGVEGTAVINFVVEKNGQITDIKVIRDPGSKLGDEAVRVVKMMPPWTAGSQNGKAVRVKFKLPVKFKLN